MLGWIGEGALTAWNKHPHPPKAGLRAAGGLRLVKRLLVIGAALLVGAAPAQVRRAAKKTVKLGDNYYSPKTLTVSAGTTVTWKWPGFDEAGDVHDVKLKSGPKGVKKFQSEAASTDYSLQAQADRRRAPTSSSARSTRR